MCSGRSGASCRYEGKTKGNIGVLMHVLPLVFAVAAATCWEKHGAARFVYDTFGGLFGFPGGGGLIDLGTAIPSKLPPSVNHLFAQPNESENPKTEKPKNRNVQQWA